MSFDEFERSNYDGAPVTLYEFSLGTTYWRYTSGQNDLVLNGNTYIAMPISNEGYSSSGSPSDDALTLKIAARAEVTQIYLGTPPSDPVMLTIRTVHRGDTDAPVVWSGTIKNAKQMSLAEYRFICNSLLSTLGRNGLRLLWGRGCPHALYDRSCRVDPADYSVSAQISALNGMELVSSAFATLDDDYLSGGFLSFVSAYGAIERRAIERHAGDTIYLLGMTDGISVDDWVTVYPGCARISLVCEEKFNNLNNYGGFPHLPNKSPFDGDPVF